MSSHQYNLPNHHTNDGSLTIFSINDPVSNIGDVVEVLNVEENPVSNIGDVVENLNVEENPVSIGDVVENLNVEENQDHHHYFTIDQRVNYHYIPLLLLGTSIVLLLLPSTQGYGLVLLCESLVRYLLRGLEGRISEIPTDYPRTFVEVINYEYIPSAVTTVSIFLLYNYVLREII